MSKVTMGIKDQQQIKSGVEVIIVNWNTRELLQNCLNSLFQHTNELKAGLELRVTVVDNASDDDSVQMLQSWFPQVKLLQNETNEGFAAANNRAMLQSEMSYFLLLNSDTLVLKNWLKPMLDFMEQHPEVGVCGPRLLNADLSLQTSCHNFPQPFGDFLNKIELYRLPGLYSLLYPSEIAKFKHDQQKAVDWLMGACLLIRRQAYEQVGLMDSSYFFYGEEMDWCYRFWKAGWQIWFVPQAEVIHLGGQSSKRVPYQRILWLNQSQLLFYRKFYSKRTRWEYQVAIWAATLPRILALALVLFFSKDARRQHRWTMLKTYWQVLWLAKSSITPKSPSL